MTYSVNSISAKVADTQGGLPENKLHCSNLGADALALAIKNYQEKATGAVASAT